MKVEEENIYNVFKYLYKKNWTVIQGGIAAVAISPPISLGNPPKYLISVQRKHSNWPKTFFLDHQGNIDD